VNQFGKKIRKVRLKMDLLQQDVASQLDIDAPMLSKIENGERNAKREHVSLLSKILKLPEEDLLSLWLADKIYNIIKDQSVAIKALSVTEKELTLNAKKLGNK